MNFDGIVATQSHAGKLLIGKMLDHLEQARVTAEEILTEIGAALDEVFLILTVADFAHALDQNAVTIIAQEAVPIGAPDALDDVPSRAAENGFQFLDDLAIAADGAVEALQIAIDYKDEVVETFARSQSDGTERFGLIHLAVAEEGPDFAAGGLLQSAGLQITHEARLVDSLNGAEAHGNGGELPKVGHQPGMGIRRETAFGLEFAAKVLQLLLGDSAFEIGAGVNSGGGVSLKVDQVAISALVLRVEKMVERDFIKSCSRGESRDMPADAFLKLVGAHHHGQRIPAD